MVNRPGHCGHPGSGPGEGEHRRRRELDEGGVGVRVRVAGACTSGADVLESFVYVVQDGFSSETARVPLLCDSTVHRSVVLVPMADFPLHSGSATASAYALVMDPDTSETAEDSPTKDITIVP